MWPQKFYFVRDGRVLCVPCLKVTELRPCEEATATQLACMRCCATIFDRPPPVAAV